MRRYSDDEPYDEERMTLMQMDFQDGFNVLDIATLYNATQKEIKEALLYCGITPEKERMRLTADINQLKDILKNRIKQKEKRGYTVERLSVVYNMAPATVRKILGGSYMKGRYSDDGPYDEESRTLMQKDFQDGFSVWDMTVLYHAIQKEIKETLLYCGITPEKERMRFTTDINQLKDIRKNRIKQKAKMGYTVERMSVVYNMAPATVRKIIEMK